MSWDVLGASVRCDCSKNQSDKKLGAWPNMTYMGMGQNPGTFCSPQNSWDLWMFISLKMVLIGIDPYPYHLKQGYGQHSPTQELEPHKLWGISGPRIEAMRPSCSWCHGDGSINQLSSNRPLVAGCPCTVVVTC